MNKSTGKRFSPTRTGMGACETGEWVRVADYDALSAECERLREKIAERDAAIEEWSGTAVQNGMEVDRLTARLAELEAPTVEPVGYTTPKMLSRMQAGAVGAKLTVERAQDECFSVALYVLPPDAQRLIDGLRSQLRLAGVAHDMTMHKVTGRHVTDLMAVTLERDELRAQLAQRTEAERTVALPPMVEFEDFVTDLFARDADARQNCSRGWLLAAWKNALDRVCRINATQEGE